MIAEKKSIGSDDIESAVAAARMCGAGVFRLDDVYRELHARKSKGLSERIERLLEADDTLFELEGVYTGRGEYFTGAEFLITPDDKEIEEGVLFPGHRFTPFVDAEVFPSEVKLSNGKTAFAVRPFEGALAELFPYHMLMGSEQVFDFFIAEHPDNSRIAADARGTDRITLNVFDLKAFFAESNFSSGDALLCRVDDYAAGLVSCKYLAGDKRTDAARRKYCAALEKAVLEVVDRFANYFDIPEQLRWSFFLGGKTLLAKPAASLDEFIRCASLIEINFDAGHTVLARRAAETDGEADGTVEIPEGVGVSRGETNDLEALLCEIGIALTPVEIDSYILDCCYTRELDFDSFYARCFGRDELGFSDEAQRVVFLNYVEERFEFLTENYDRVSDEPKGDVRGTILEILDEKNLFLAELKRDPEALEKIDSDKLRRLAEITLYCDNLLELLNSAAHTFEEGEAEAMSETIGDLAETQHDLLESINLEG